MSTVTGIALPATADRSAAPRPSSASCLGIDPAGQGRQRLDRDQRRDRLLGEQPRAARSGERPTMVCASRRLTVRATRCCWAPSWRSRSRRLRSASWVSMRRSREALISSERTSSSARRSSSSARSPNPLQHQAGLGGQPGEQPFLDESESQTGSLLEPEHPQQLAAVAHRQGSHALVGHDACPRVAGGGASDRRRRRGARWRPGSGGRKR